MSMLSDSHDVHAKFRMLVISEKNPMLDWVTILTLVIVLGIIIRKSLSQSRNVFDGYTVIITGGSSGIGLAFAKSVVANHAPKRVVLLARNATVLGRAQVEVTRARSSQITEVDIMTCDVSNDKECEVVARKLGNVDILVNCAGVSYPTELENLKISEIQTMVNTNLLGCVFLTRCIVPTMKSKKGGIVVFVASQAAQCGLYGYSVYSATKFAIRGFAEALQMELKPFGISVCVSYPPDTNTEGYIKENEMKPEATRLMSEGSLMDPHQVADSMRIGINHRSFSIWSNFDGFMLTQLTCGFSPPNSIIHLIYQVPLMSVMRIVSSCYRIHFDSIARICVREDSSRAFDRKSE